MAMRTIYTHTTHHRALPTALLGLLGLLALVLAGCGAASGPGQGSSTALPYTITTANIRAFPMPKPQSGLMRPAVDSQGNIWFGEMTGNRLGRLNPHTGQVDEWTPPNADYGIMGIVVDAQDHIWFA